MANKILSAQFMILVGGILIVLNSIIGILIGLMDYGPWFISTTLVIGLIIIVLGAMIYKNSKKIKLLSKLALIFTVAYFIIGGLLSLALILTGNDFLTIIIMPLIYLVAFLISLIGSLKGLSTKNTQEIKHTKGAK
ncbi:MAG: hypothetical protein ACP5RT_02295 [Candidatus Micrarchaeia archaeon]